MKFTHYSIASECYPRYKNAMKRISDILQRTDKLITETVGKSHQTGEDMKLTENIDIYTCEIEESEKLDLNGENLVMKTHGKLNPVIYECKSIEEFLTQNREDLDPSTILTFRECKDLSKTGITFSSGKDIATEICALLEQAAFKPMRDNFEFIKSLLIPNPKEIDDTVCSGSSIESKMSTRSKFSNGKQYNNGEKFDETKGQQENKMHINRWEIKTKYDEIKELKLSAMKGHAVLVGIDGDGHLALKVQTRNASSSSTSLDDKGNRRKRRREHLRSCTSRDEVQHSARSSSFSLDNKGSRRKQRREHSLSGTSRYDVQHSARSSSFSLDNKGSRRKQRREHSLSGTSRYDVQHSARSSSSSLDNKGSRRKRRREHSLSGTSRDDVQHSARSSSFSLDNKGNRRKRRREHSLSGTSRDDVQHSEEKSKDKFVENKPKFQRLLGEMIGMYKRSNLPDDQKPDLDGPPEGKVSEEIMGKVYQISSSIKGFSYLYNTRLQIHVLTNDIEKLRPQIENELCTHGYALNGYDIVPPVDEVVPLNKVIVGSKVENEKFFGTVGGFVENTSKQQKEPSVCIISSKHLLDGRKKVKVVNEKHTLFADVIKETAPDDNDMTYDIAAAKVSKHDEKHCEGKFKREDGTLMKGVMFDKDASLLDCQYVHIHGASTSKGLGIVAITNFNRRDSTQTETGNTQPGQIHGKADDEESNKFIYIESRPESEPFCKGGDSGAMVCADDEDGDHVKLISTVIGENNEGRFQTLRLKSGVSYLEKITGSKIRFFEN